MGRQQCVLAFNSFSFNFAQSRHELPRGSHGLCLVAEFKAEIKKYSPPVAGGAMSGRDLALLNLTFWQATFRYPHAKDLTLQPGGLYFVRLTTDSDTRLSRVVMLGR